MSPSNRFGASLRALAIALLACCTFGVAMAQAPAALQGRWVVEQVAVDRDDAIQRSNEPDDPRLMGGILDILSDGTIDPSREDCKRATWRHVGSTTLTRLVGRNARTSSGKTFTPSLAEYGLSLADATIITYVALCEPQTRGGRAEPYDGKNVFASLSKDRMLESNGVDTILVYSRITPTTPVQPSFACTGTLQDAEKTICGSQVLAGLDRSVAAAYKRGRVRLENRKTEIESLRQSQDAWILERNRCKTDDNCLSQSMSARISELMQQ